MTYRYLGLLVAIAGCGGGEVGAFVGSDLGLIAKEELPSSIFKLDTSGDARDVAAGPDAVGVPGWFGAPCTSNDECPSSWCVEGHCTKTCVDDCPTDWLCKGSTAFGPDVVYLCTPKSKLLCQPCLNDSDCGGIEARCLDLGTAEGRWCGRACADEDACPDGFSCTAIEGVATRQCRPLSGSCTCGAKSEAKTEACQAVNAFGACNGYRTCHGKDGWSACDAVAPASETCNAIDDDCDGAIDDGEGAPGCKTHYADVDGDGAGNASDIKCLCGPTGTYRAVIAGDCDDTNPQQKAGAPEICNVEDDDCDGSVDPPGSAGCVTYLRDADKDGWGKAGDSQCLCSPSAPYTSLIAGDCDDELATANPTAPELCNGKDDDCDNVIDDGVGGATCPIAKVAGTCLGLTVCDQGTLTCVGKPPGPELCNGGDDDCNGKIDDALTANEPCENTNPFGTCKGVSVCQGVLGLSCLAKTPTPEFCNGQDDDCDGTIDPPKSGGCVTYAKDADQDGWGEAGDVLCLCSPQPPYTALIVGDCDDTAKGVHPGSIELCDGLDQNCDGLPDDGIGNAPCAVKSPFGACPGVTSCSLGFPECIGKYPTAEECNGSDDDCDGAIDEGTAGAPCAAVNELGTCVGKMACLGAEGPACTAKPPSVEACNLIDDDCNGVTDPPGSMGCSTFARDEDGDGWGKDGDSQCLCAPMPPYTALIVGDCDDLTKSIHVGGLEICNSKDDNCDSLIDENTAGTPCAITGEFGTCTGVTSCDGGKITCLGKTAKLEVCNGQDDDCDGAIDEGTSGGACGISGESGTCLGTYVCAGVDGLKCSATAPASEACNGFDDDCDGQIDEPDASGCQIYHADLDHDGFGSTDPNAVKCLCKPNATYSSFSGGDCDDTDAQAHPGASELCNGVDDNCNKATDEAGSSGCSIYLKDEDGDGYGVGVSGKCLCAPDDVFKTLESGDCNDKNPDLKPGAVEACDGLDQNCNFLIDETCDKDGDGYCALGATIVGTPQVCKNGIGDCDDLSPAVHPKGLEVCNGQDDDCDGDFDEGVTSPCGGCNTVCTMHAGVGTATGWSPDTKSYNGTGVDPATNIIKLDAKTTQFNILWVSNSGEGSVSKLDTTTSKEVARYFVCSDPSRTAVDSDGNAWVGCRGDGRVAKIALAPADCLDRDKNGTIETSKDTNGNGVIDGGEALAEGKDECVLFTVQPDGSTVARALGIDNKGDAWVGFWNTKRLRKLGHADGAVLKSIDLPANPYGLAIAQDGDIWVAGRGGSLLVHVNPESGVVASYQPNIGCFEPYGISIDENGRIWTANCCCSHVAYRFDPVAKTWAAAAVQARPRGIAADGNGFVFVANDESHRVAKVNVNTMEVAGYATLNADGAARYPVGMAVDFEGKVWAVNYSSSSAQRIDPNTMTVISEGKTGSHPYTYSDMNGYALKTVVAPVGTYVQVFEGWDAVTTRWTSIDLNVELPTETSVEVRYRSASTPTGLQTAVWSQYFGPFPPETLPFAIPSWAQPVGRYFAVEVRLKSEKKQGSPFLKNISVTATVGP